MKKCSNPAHPHCTYWVTPGDSACAGGHGQAASALSSYELLSAARSKRPAPTELAHPASLAAAHPLPSTDSSPARSFLPASQAPGNPYAANPAAGSALSARRHMGSPVLHVSGFDPRAAGGRQTLKLELRGMPDTCAPEMTMRLQSDLMPNGSNIQKLTRSTRGDWCPVLVEFSSRNKEHGQYRIEAEVLSQVNGKLAQKWVCTMVILVPRRDASLTEIHQIFLGTHKNVRIVAEDASIARVSAHGTHGGHGMDIDVTARNAGIAHVDLSGPKGKVDMGMATIAWDEDLIEIDVPGASHNHPHPSRAACLVNAAPEGRWPRHLRMFAMDECVLGRFELVDPDSDVLLSHYGDRGQDNQGLTRRLSGRHAVIRRAGKGFEIEDVSRYGILLDGVWPGKHKPTALRLGMRIELSASIKGIVILSVSALMPHGVILHRIDAGAQAECFYLLCPDKHPGFPVRNFTASPIAAALPLIFHNDGGFWHLDQLTGKETALAPATALDKLSRVPRHNRFAAGAYPECFIIRTGAGESQDNTASAAPATPYSPSMSAA
jgi:hypothetical protein